MNTKTLKLILEHYSNWLLQSGLMTEGLNHDKLVMAYLEESSKERMHIEVQEYKIRPEVKA